MTPEQLAQVALDALKIREDSWNEVQSPDWAGNQYTKDWHQSIEEACQKQDPPVDKRFAYPIYLGLSDFTGDFIDWAKETLGLQPPESEPPAGVGEPIQVTGETEGEDGPDPRD